jgi:Spy/CpxP family protein refolding chaperone
MRLKSSFLATAATALVLMASPVLAQQMGGTGQANMPVMMERHSGNMERLGVSSEKRESIRLIQGDYQDRLFRLGQDIYARGAALNAIMLQPQPDPIAAKAVSREISNLKVQEMDLLIEMHTRIARETGVRMPMGTCAGRMMLY